MRMLITFLNNQLPYALQCTVQTVTHESEWVRV